MEQVLDVMISIIIVSWEGKKKKVSVYSEEWQEMNFTHQLVELSEATDSEQETKS